MRVTGWFLLLASMLVPFESQAGLMLVATGSGQIDRVDSAEGFVLVTQGTLDGPLTAQDLVPGARFDFTLRFDTDFAGGALDVRVGGKPFFSLPASILLSTTTVATASTPIGAGTGAFFAGFELTFPVPIDFLLAGPIAMDPNVVPNRFRGEIGCVLCGVLAPNVIEGRVLQSNVRLAVPEPGAGLTVLGLLALAGARRRRRAR